MILSNFGKNPFFPRKAPKYSPIKLNFVFFAFLDELDYQVILAKQNFTFQLNL